MKVRIETPIDACEYEMDAYFALALVQQAHIFAEGNAKGKEEEKTTEEENTEPLPEAVTTVCGVPEREHEESIASEYENGETAETAVYKPQKRSRTDSLFGVGWRNQLPENTSHRDEEHEARETEDGCRGFLYIKCPVCGKITEFNAKNRIKEFRCSCGRVFAIRNLRMMYTDCGCGGHFKYLTNMDEESFSYKCFKCGRPVRIRINSRHTAYVTERKSIGGGHTQLRSCRRNETV